MNQQKIILFIDHAMGLGGAQINLLKIIERISGNRWKPVLAGPEGALTERAKSLGIEVEYISIPRLRRSSRFLIDWFQGGYQIRKLAEEKEANIIFSNTVRATLYTSLAAKALKIPYIWYMQDYWLAETRPKYLYLDRLQKSWISTAASLVLVNSNDTRNYLHPNNEIQVLYPGIDLEQFQPSQSDNRFRQKHNISSKMPLIGTVGRLRPWKGPDRFLRVMARVAQNFPTARFMLVGGSPLNVYDGFADSLPALAEKLGISERVILTGHLEDVRPALAAMDIFVHPGDPEPFGLVNIEAMAMEKPVVAFSHGALPEIVVNGETGLLLPPGDEEGMARSIFFLLNNPNEIRTMGQKGRVRVTELFTIQQTVAKLAAILSQLIGK